MHSSTSGQRSNTSTGKGFSYRKTLLALCIGAAIQPTAWAQSDTRAESEQTPSSRAGSKEDAKELDAMIVTGIRGALMRAQDFKRDADTHLDAISAVDISALPDVSVLEALQRVPGIAIERFAASNDPDHFSTEGSGITLRGLPNTRSEFNGRDTFSANSGRGLSFQDVSPELIGSVEVFKNQTADMVEGGISGTVNLNTRKPFDSNDRVLQFSGQANYGDLEGETTPSFSGLFSNVWAVGSGQMGFLASLAKSDLDFRSEGAQFGQHVAVPGTTGASTRYAPINAGIRTTSTNRQRTGASMALQYENADRTFDMTTEYIRSDSDSDWTERAFFSDDGGGSPSASSTYAGQVFQSGSIVGVAPGLGPQTRRQFGNTLVEDFSVKFNFRPTDRLRLSTDLQYVDSSTDITDLSVFGGMARQGATVGGVNIDLVNRGGTPGITFRAPTGSGQTDAQYFSDPNNYFWRAAMDHLEESEGDEVAFRFDADYELHGNFFREVETGIRFAERDQTTRWSTYNWGNLSESWTGNGLASFAGGATSSGFSQNGASPFSFGDFHGGNVGGLPGGVGIFPNVGLLSSHQTFRNAFDGPGVFRGSLSGRAGTDGGFYTPAEINSTNEQNSAAYFQLNFENDAERRFGGNVGVRWVKQDTRVAGGITFPTLNLSPEVLATLPASVRAFANGASSNEDATSSNDYFLPSLNLKYEFMPDLILRFGASKAVAFPELGNLRYNYNIAANINTVDGVATLQRFFQSSGNPYLRPMQSNNIDLSLEYYFSDSDYLSVGLFYKDIRDFFSNNTIETQVTNNGVTQLVDIDQPINIGEASIRGLELSYQHFFDQLPGVWSGLGVQFNYSYLDPSSVPQQNLRPVQSGDPTDAARASIPFDNLPLQGLSENQGNLVGLFQNDKFEARLAYNWRDDYLLTIREVNIGLPTFAKSSGQLDGSMFYRFSPKWQIGLQASNLLQDEIVTENQVDSAGLRVFRSSFIFDTRYTLVLRGQF